MAWPHLEFATNALCEVLNTTHETSSPFFNGGLRVSMIVRAIKLIIQMPTGVT
jgi:hypothetical protein